MYKNDETKDNCSCVLQRDRNGDGLGYFGIGAGIGALSAFTGGALASVTNVVGVFAGAGVGALGGAVTGGATNVLLNGCNNVLQGNHFFSNWSNALLSGAISGALTGAISGGFSGGQKALESGRNVWWGSEVKNGRTQWSFFTSEKPYLTIDFKDLPLISKYSNDCAPATFTEINDFYNGGKSYESFMQVLKYKTDEGIYLGPDRIKNLMGAYFNVSDFDMASLSNTGFMESLAKNDNLVSLFINYSEKMRHLDNIRYLKYYSNKISVGLRIGSYKLTDLTDKTIWALLINGLKY